MAELMNSWNIITVRWMKNLHKMKIVECKFWMSRIRSKIIINSIVGALKSPLVLVCFSFYWRGFGGAGNKKARKTNKAGFQCKIIYFIGCRGCIIHSFKCEVVWFDAENQTQPFFLSFFSINLTWRERVREQFGFEEKWNSVSFHFPAPSERVN